MLSPLRLITACLLCWCCVLPLGATSQTIVGIIVETVLDGDKPRVVVRILWDSAGKAHEGHKSFRPGNKWPGCQFLLDGEEAAVAAVCKPGNLVFVSLNRQKLRLVAATPLPEDRLAALRPAGKNYVIADCGGAIPDPRGRKGRSTNLLLYAALDGGKAARVVAQAPRYSTLGTRIDAQDLTVADGRLQGSVQLTVPGCEGKHPKPALAAKYTIDLPLDGTDGTLGGTVADKKVTGRARARVHGLPALPAQGVLWCTVPDKGHGHQLAIPFTDGTPQIEHCYALFGKGYIIGKGTEVAGSVSATAVDLTVTYDLKGSERTVRLQGPVCGDRVGGTATIGDTSSTFFGGILPADVCHRGYLGHQTDYLPPRGG